MKRNLSSGQGITYSIFNGNKLTQNDVQAITDYADALKRGMSTGDAWKNSMSDCSVAAKQYVVSAKKAGKSTDELVTELKDVPKATTAASIGLKALSIAGNMLAMWAISEGIQLIGDLITAQDRLADEAQDLGNEFKNTEADIDDYKTKVEDLYNTINDSSSSYEEVTQARKDLMAIQDELIDKFGDEKGAIDLITDAINGQTEAFEGLKESQYQKMMNDFNKKDGLGDYITYAGTSKFEQMKKDMEDSTITLFASGNKKINDYIKSLGATEVIDSASGVKTYELNGNLNDIYDKLLDIQSLADDLGANDYSQELSTQINQADELITKYEDMYNAYVLYEKVLNSDEKNDYDDMFSNINEAYQKYQDAVISGDEAKIKETTDKYGQTVAESINKALANGDKDVAQYFEQMYPELQEIAGSWSFELKFKAAIDDDEDNFENDIKDAVSKFNTDEDIRNYNPKTATDEQITAYTKLEEVMNNYGLSIDQLIEKLIQLGLVQSQTKEDLLDKLIPSRSGLNSGSSSIMSNIMAGVDSAIATEWVESLTEEEAKLANSPEFTQALEEQKEKLNGVALSADDYSVALKKVQQAQSSVENTPKWDYSETITQLDAMKDKFNVLDESYAKLFEEDSQLGFDDLASINETFNDVDGIDDYVKRIQEAGQNADEVSAIMGELISSTQEYQNAIDNVTNENASLIASFLEEHGIANANAIVMETLAAKKAYTAETSQDLANATAEDVANFLQESDASEETKNKIAEYYAEKVLAAGVALDTSADVAQLMAFISALGGATSALSIYYSMLNGTANVTTINGKNGHGGLSGTDAQYAQQMAQVQAKAELEKILEDTKANVSTPQFTGGSASSKAREDAAKGASDKAKDAASEAEEAAKKAEEQLTDALSRIKNAIDELDAEASDKFSKWSTRNDALEAEMGKVKEAIGAQQQLVDFYNSRGDVTKAQEAANAVKDLQRQLKELAQQKLENIKKFNEDIVSLIESLKELTQSYIDIKEARGIAFSESDYNELISKSEEERKQYETELSQLQAQLQENIDNGYLEEGSEAWYEWQTELNKIKKSINECTKEQIEWNKAIKKMPLEAIEKYINAANRITNLLNAQQELLEARGIGENITDIMAHLIANSNDIGNAEGQIREYTKLIHDGFSDGVNGWAELTEEQINQILYYIKNGWDEGAMNQYLAGLGIDSSRLTELDEYIQKLGEAEQSLLSAKKEQVEWNKAIQKLNVTRAENYSVLIDKISTELETATNALDARGLSEGINEYNQQLAVAKEQISGLSNQLSQQNKIIFDGLTDTTNGWVKNALTNEQINKVTELISHNDSQGLFDLLSSLGEDPGSMTELFSTIENIGELSNQIKEIENNQIELNKALLQMDITAYENLNELLEKAKTEIEGLRSLIESHGNTASDNLLSTQIENAMKAIELSKSKINSYNEYIRDSFSDSVTGWASLTKEQINEIFKYLNSNDTEGLESYFNSLGLSSASLTEFWEVVGNIRNEENNILSEMVNQEGYFDDMLENRITQLDKIKEQLQKINDAKNKALELEKARYALIEAQNNRNVMTWDGNQMVWTQDNDKVSDALENLNNLEFQALIDSIDDATDAIRDLMDDKNLYDDNGNLLSNWQDIIKTAQTSVTDIITGIVSKLNERGYDIKVPQFGTGGVINGDKGDNNLIRVADKERVLTPAQNDIYEKFLNFAMDNYNSMMQNMIPSNLTPKNYDIVRKNDNVKMVTYQLNGDFVMPNVHDASKVSDLIKDLESIEIKAQQRVGRIN